jgi:histidine phosphotransferase ChpT
MVCRGGVSHGRSFVPKAIRFFRESRPRMSQPVTLEALDLTALVCSRVCHDVISPVGAIVNGLEVLADEKDEKMKEVALDLIRKSAIQASARLQFARLAFGAAGSAGAQIDLGDAAEVANGFFADERLKLVWNLPRVLLPKNRVKLLLNLLMIASAAIPRGGTLTVDPVGEGESMGFRLRAEGTNARIPPKAEALLAGNSTETLDAHVIQPYYAGLLARAAGLTVSIAPEGEAIVLSATP